MPARRDLTTPYQGDAFTHVVKFVDDDGDPMDVTGRTWLSQVRRRWSDTTVDAQFTVDVSQAATGQVTFTLPGSVLENMIPGKYRYDLQWTVGGVTFTVLAGEFLVTGEISR